MEETTLQAKLNFWKALATLLKLTYVLPSTISFNIIYHDAMISTEVLTALLIYINPMLQQKNLPVICKNHCTRLNVILLVLFHCSIGGSFNVCLTP